MEIPQGLAIESFSQSWLTSLNSSLHGLGESIRPSLDHTPSYYNNLNFNFPISQSSDDVLVHADKLFSDGLIRPAPNTPTTTIQATKPSPSFSSRRSNIAPSTQIHCNSFWRWRKPSLQMLARCFKLVIRPMVGQLRRSIKGSNIGGRIDDMERRAVQVKRQRSDSPAPNFGHSRADHYDFTDNSIDEAVLHCKRSILE